MYLKKLERMILPRNKVKSSSIRPAFWKIPDCRVFCACIPPISIYIFPMITNSIEGGHRGFRPLIDAFASVGFTQDFAMLPEECPYGFWIADDGSFLALKLSFSHTLIINQIKELTGLTGAPYSLGYELGLLRAVNEEKYLSVDINHKTSRAARKTAMDLSEFYGMEIMVDM